MIRLFFILSGFLLLSACSTVLDGATQVVNIQTPGADGGVCYIERPGYRQRVWVPMQVHITKSEDPLTLTCIAPGNRVVRKIVEPKITNTTLLNATNAGLGAFVDYESGAMFEFPDTIVIDFTNVEVASMGKPDYHTLLQKHPELMGLEEFRPGRSALLRDRGETVPDLTPRRSDAHLYSGQGLTELRMPGETLYFSPEQVGQGAEPAGEAAKEPGGEPVIGGGAADDIGTALPPGVEPLTAQ